MEDDMAPPNKRRKLLPSILESLPLLRSDFTPKERAPTLLHTVQELDTKQQSTPVAHTVPKRIEEIHLQIQQRGAAHQRNVRRHLYPRQGATAITTDITSINGQGQTITTEVTIGATTATPTTSTDSTESSTPSSSTATETSANASSASLSQATSNTQNSTTSATSQESLKTTKTTPLSSIYTATLSDHEVVTVTRHDKPYVTTFKGGITSTICNLGDVQCTLSDETRSSTLNNAVPPPASTTAAANTYAASNPVSGTDTSASSSATAVTPNDSNDNSTPPPGTIAGGVVGGAAGLAVILLLAMVLLRWYKRRQQLGHHTLAQTSAMLPNPDTSQSRGPGMAERAGLRPLVTAVPGFFRHQNNSDIEPPSSERSFQRVSGRKLPSAFSEGMNSADMVGSAASVPSTAHDRNYSNLSFYRDSNGFYGGGDEVDERATSPDEVPPLQSESGGVMLSPGPQRRPTVHTGGPFLLTPSSSMPSTPNMQSPTLAPIPGSPPDHHRNLYRSSTPSTFTDNRSSRFTEEV